MSNSLRPHGLYSPQSPWNSLDQSTGVGSLSLPSPAFSLPLSLPNLGIEPRPPSLQADSLPAKPQGSPRALEWVAYPFCRGSSEVRNRTKVSCIEGEFYTN